MSYDLETTYRILDEATEEHQPSHLIACFSGGYDSMIMTHLAVKWAKERRYPLLTIAVDTLISADGWREFVTLSAERIGATDFQIWNNPDLELWANDVKTRGFVYRKAQHPFYFYYLKQRVFRSMVAHYKTHLHDRVMFLNGIRRSESIDRRHVPETERKGSGVFVNPILFWSDEAVQQYRIDHDLPLNPFYDRTHNSGDCLCNWHNHISVAELHQFGSGAAKTIDPLREWNVKVFGYDYDDEAPVSQKQEAAGQQRLFDWDTDCTPNLCAGCNKPEPTNTALDFVQLQRMDWSDQP